MGVRKLTKLPTLKQQQYVARSIKNTSKIDEDIVLRYIEISLLAIFILKLVVRG